MNYKLLVLDLDGTLTNSKKEITPFTRETLLQAQEKGLHLVLASGRPTYGIVPLAEELNIKQYGGFILSFNGGKVIDLMTDKVLFEQACHPISYLFYTTAPKKRDWLSFPTTVNIS